jgi:hypothetical protein
MKRLIAVSLFTLVLSSNVHAKVNMKYVKPIQWLKVDLCTVSLHI